MGKWILIFSMLTTGLSASAQDSGENTMKLPSLKPFKQFSLGLQLSQETIEARTPLDKTKILFHFEAVDFAYTYNRFFKNSFWRLAYRGSLQIGRAKGHDSAGVLQKDLKEQTFVGVGFAPMLVYRTAPVSEVGFALPVALRGIKWNAEEDEVDLERRGSVSLGLGLVYMNRFSRRNSFYASLAHQFMWDSTMISAGWTYTFR